MAPGQGAAVVVVASTGSDVHLNNDADDATADIAVAADDNSGVAVHTWPLPPHTLGAAAASSEKDVAFAGTFAAAVGDPSAVLHHVDRYYRLSKDIWLDKLIIKFILFAIYRFYSVLRSCAGDCGANDDGMEADPECAYSWAALWPLPVDGAHRAAVGPSSFARDAYGPVYGCH